MTIRASSVVTRPSPIISSSLGITVALPLFSGHVIVELGAPRPSEREGHPRRTLPRRGGVMGRSALHREVPFPHRPGGYVRRTDVAFEDLGGEVQRTADVRDVDDAANPALYRGRPEQDVRLLVGVAAVLEILDGVQASLPEGDVGVQGELVAVLVNRDALEDQEVRVPGLEVTQLEDRHVLVAGHSVLLHAALYELHPEFDEARHLDGAAEGDLAIPLREVQVAHRELRPLDVHREVDAGPNGEVLYVHVAAVLARRDRPGRLARDPVELLRACLQSAQDGFVGEWWQRQRRHPLGVHVYESLLATVPLGQKLGGGGAADKPRVLYADEPDVRNVPAGRVEAPEVPDRLVRLRVVVGQEAATVLPGEDASVAPLCVGSKLQNANAGTETVALSRFVKHK